jgi:DNA replication protein DnaC
MSEQEKSEKIQWLAKMAKVPLRFKSASFDNFQADSKKQEGVKQKCQNLVDKFPAILDDGLGGAIFYGTVGTGKTHMAISIIRALIKKYHARCRYVNVFDLIDEVRATWSRKDVHADEVIKKFSEYHFLVIDEIGVQYGSDSEKTILFQVVNQRSLNKLPTVLISNLDEKGLNECVGERVIDRIYESGGGAIAFTWDSYRRK